MKRLLAAWRFLTVIPLAGHVRTDDEDTARAVGVFPVVGILVGLVTAFVAWFCGAWMPAWLLGTVVTCVPTVLSGGLHADGLADSADGLLSSRNRARMLEIMKDSRIGTMGVLALVFTILLRAGAYAALVDIELLGRACILVPLLGRSSMVVYMALCPYIRPGGLGTLFYRHPLQRPALFAGVAMLAGGMLLAGPGGLMVALLSLGFTYLFAHYTIRALGGATGDTIGANCELVETLAVVLLVAA